MAGNHPTGAAVLCTAISFIFLLGGTAIVLLAFGKFDYLGWHGTPAARDAWVLRDSQKAVLKYMTVAAILLLGQTFFGAGVAHYRADPGTFYGIDLLFAGALPLACAVTMGYLTLWKRGHNPGRDGARTLGYCQRWRRFMRGAADEYRSVFLSVPKTKDHRRAACARGRQYV